MIADPAKLDALFGAPTYDDNLTGIIGLAGRTPVDPWRKRCAARIPGVCEQWATNAHHVVLRSRGGDDGRTLPVCGSGTTGCHGWIHAHPAEALERGLIERPHG